MKKIFLTLAISSLLISSCTTDPYTGESKLSNSLIFSGGGAAAGALAGQALGGNTKSTLIGAGVGALVGGGLGYYFDNQEAKLRKELEGTGVGVKRDKNGIKLIMPGNITFKSNSSNINSSFYKVLNSVSKVFKKYKKTNIEINGYTDSTGSASYNKELSLQRADSVAQYFVSHDISKRRISTHGYGEKYPIASNNSASGREKNRRVEIEILPIK